MTVDMSRRSEKNRLVETTENDGIRIDPQLFISFTFFTHFDSLITKVLKNK